MFKSAYIRLTAFYVGLLFILSVLFSFWLYKEATRELTIGLRAPFSMVTGNLNQNSFTSPFDFDHSSFIDKRIQEGKNRVIANLVILNIVILVGGGVASYGLARRTMRPIEEAMEAQNRFTSDASHELRTPLAAMKLETEIALRNGKKLDKSTKELLASNLEEIDRMGKLSEDLLLLARGKSPYSIQKLRLDELVKIVTQRLSPLAKQKSISFIEELVPLSVQARSEEIERVLTILLDNATKYSPKQSQVTIQLSKSGDQAKITIQDVGIGISKEDSLHIFDRFYRADSARTESATNGYGLGLPIAQKIVKEHGGRIYVTSELGKGSCFTVKLPLAK